VSDNDYIVRELRVGDEHEAALLADMWNRSEEGWPGGRLGGVVLTADRVLREYMRWHCHGQWVAEHAGEIVGYVDLFSDPPPRQTAYVGLLNARPDHHGRGVGRRLLLHAIRQAIDDGFERVELRTWAGNLKAVPLYKKCGLFWSPETNVLMQGFIPTIVRMPLLEAFFRDHDWYHVQDRDLSVTEDVDWWHGVRVYRYRFHADGRQVEVIVDRQALMPTAVATNELAVAAWVPAEDLPALQEHTLHYEFENRTGRPLRLALRAEGEAGVGLDAQDSFVLTGKKSIQVPFRLPVDLERKQPGEPPHRIISAITVDGVAIQLGTAVRMRHPVEVEYAGQGMPAGKWSEVRVQLRNRLPFPVRGVLHVGLPREMERDCEELPFRLSRDGWTSVSFRARAATPGAHRLDLQVGLAEETANRLARGETAPLPSRGRTRTAWLRAFAPGMFVLSDDDHEREVTAESDRFMVTFSRVGGVLVLHSKTAGRPLATILMPKLGPPFGTSRPLPEVQDVDASVADGAVRLVTRQRDERYPGVELQRTVLVASGLAELRHSLVNTGAAPAEVSVKAAYMSQLYEGGTFARPAAGRIVRHERMGWRDWPRSGEATHGPADGGESWAAMETRGAVVGAAWQGQAEAAFQGFGAEIVFGPVQLPVGGRVDLPPAYVVAAEGDYTLVRAVWETYVRPTALVRPEELDPPVCELLAGGFERPAVIPDRRPLKASVELTSHQDAPLDGRARISLPPVVRLADGSRQQSLPVAGLSRQKPFRHAVTLRAQADGPTAGQGELVFASSRQSYRFPLPVIIIRESGRRLRLHAEGDTVSVDTGQLEFLVSAQHGGSIAWLRSGGRELLRSSYPTPGPYLYQNPWYGGALGRTGSPWDPRLSAVRRTIEAISLRGTSGTVWQGARVTVVPQQADCGWLRWEVSYLSTAGSNLVSVSVKARRTTSAAMGTDLGIELWPAKDVRRAYVRPGERRSGYMPDRYYYSARSRDGWACLDCGRGAYLAFAARPKPFGGVTLTNLGDGCFSVEAQCPAMLTPPVKSHTLTAWLAACRSLEEASAYQFLRELEALP
jgi:GNAT superfamily N-acetyltransferase